MRWDELETDIVARLQADAELISYVDVNNIVTLPETNEVYDYFEKGWVKPKIAVAWGAEEAIVSRETNNTSRTIGMVTEYSDVTLDVLLVFRKLRGDGACYHIIDIVKKILVGYKHSNMNAPINLVNAGLVEKRASLFFYQIKFSTKVPIIQDARVRPTIPVTNPNQLLTTGNYVSAPLTDPQII
jgi:hypothetical protein